MRLGTSPRENGRISPAHCAHLARYRPVWRFFWRELLVARILDFPSRRVRDSFYTFVHAIKTIAGRRNFGTSSNHFFTSVLLVAIRRCHCVHVQAPHRRCARAAARVNLTWSVRAFATPQFRTVSSGGDITTLVTPQTGAIPNFHGNVSSVLPRSYHPWEYQHSLIGIGQTTQRILSNKSG